MSPDPNQQPFARLSSHSHISTSMGYGPVHTLNNGQSNQWSEYCGQRDCTEWQFLFATKLQFHCNCWGHWMGYSVQTDNNGRQYLFRLCGGDFLSHIHFSRNFTKDLSKRWIDTNNSRYSHFTANLHRPGERWYGGWVDSVEYVEWCYHTSRAIKYLNNLPGAKISIRPDYYYYNIWMIVIAGAFWGPSTHYSCSTEQSELVSPYLWYLHGHLLKLWTHWNGQDI